MKIDALLDSNVLIAMLVEAHEHHEPSLALLASEGDTQFAVAAHTYAEAYSTLTRRGEQRRSVSRPRRPGQRWKAFAP